MVEACFHLEVHLPPIWPAQRRAMRLRGGGLGAAGQR
jgi:hypothetical protein